MKLIRAAVLIAFIFLIASAKAQQTHFIYIQTSDKQPFYVKLGKNVYSSSTSGYLIISKLLDSSYNFSIGFPKAEWVQQNFNCTIDGNDKGYLLKQFGDKGWGLFNLQTLDVTMAGNKPAENRNSTKEERTDSFSNMLSAVVKDPGIKMTEKKKPEVKPDTVQQIVEADPVIAKNTEAIEPVPVIAAKPVAANKKPAKKISTIIKLLERTDNDGTQLVYLDIYQGHKDTVRIFVPADKTVAIAVPPAEVKPVVVAPEAPTVPTEATVAPPTVKAKPKTDPKKFIDMDVPVSNTDTTVKVSSKINNTNSDKPTVSSNGNCKAIASDDDFLKLRKKMAAEEAEDNMASVAIKVFKTKCFSTSQIKNLGFLFLTDKGRFNFFNKAYSFVSDPENYGTLDTQFSEATYIARFKELINH